MVILEVVLQTVLQGRLVGDCGLNSVDDSRGDEVTPVIIVIETILDIGGREGVRVVDVVKGPILEEICQGSIFCRGKESGSAGIEGPVQIAGAKLLPWSLNNDCPMLAKLDESSGARKSSKV